MGILTPQAYDQLFLEKCKLLLQSALNNSRRRGPDISYEEFVEGLDIRDEGSLRVFEVLLYETSTRRPPKHQPRSQPGPSSERAGSTIQRRPRIPSRQSGAAAPNDEAESSFVRVLNLDMDHDSSSEEELLPPRRRRTLPPRTLHPRHSAQEPGGANGTDDISPSLRLRRQQLNELFGTSTETPMTLHEMLDVAGSIDSLDARWPSRPQRASSSASSSAPLLPTFAELWSILTDEPFPSSTITSYSSFLAALNRCPAVSSATTTPLAATGMRELLDELAQRDLAFPIRLTNLLQQREGAGRHASGGATGRGRSAASTDGERDATGEGSRARTTDEAGAGPSPLREGIWRASFIEHLEDGSLRALPAGTSEGGYDASASAFEDFTGRRRAQQRRRDEAGGTVSPAGSSTTPAITVTDASIAPTPATTAAQSPSPPSAADCPPARQTSAAIAEAAFRSQRLIAPLPSSSSSTPARAPSQDDERADEMSEGQASMRAVFEALERARQRHLAAMEPDDMLL